MNSADHKQGMSKSGTERIGAQIHGTERRDTERSSLVERNGTQYTERRVVWNGLARKYADHAKQKGIYLE